MKMMLLTLLTVLGVIWSSHQSELCPELPGEFPFDTKQFEGEWFTLARSYVPIAPQDNAVCWKNHVTTNASGMEVKVLSDYKDGSSKVFDVRGVFVDLENNGAVLESTFNLGKGMPYHGVGRQSILATDYKTFALHYFCLGIFDEERDTFTRLIAAEVWSRTPTMDTEELEALKAVVSSDDNLKTSSITNINQSGCK